MIEIGLSHLASISQIYYSHRNNCITLLVANNVDSLLITGGAVVVENFVTLFTEKFTFGTVAHSQRILGSFALTIEQLGD